MVPLDEHIQTTVEHLDPNIEIVLYPDHPLLNRAPDIITKEESGISAYYFINELNSASVNAAVILGRLAFPTSTRFIQVFTESEIYDHRSTIAEQMTMDDVKNRRAPNGDTDENRSLTAAIDVIKNHNLARFSQAWYTGGATEYQSTEGPQPQPEIHRGLAWTSTSRIPFSDENDRIEIHLDPALSDLENNSKIRSAINWAAEIDFGLTQEGNLLDIAYRLQSRVSRLQTHQIIGDIPALSNKVHDPLKLYRCAAFAGIASTGYTFNINAGGTDD